VKNLLLALCYAGLASFPEFALAQSDTISNRPVWLSLNIIPKDPNKGVLAVAHWKGKLYAGGNFPALGADLAPQGVAVFEGNTWKSIGAVNSYGMVEALRFDTAGILIAGGRFDSIGGIRAKNIAQWDGRAWSAMDSVATGIEPIRILEVDEKNVIYGAGNARLDEGSTRFSCYYSINILAWKGKAASVFEEERFRECTCDICPYRNRGIDAMAANFANGLLYSGVIGNYDIRNIDNTSNLNRELTEVTAIAVTREGTIFLAGKVPSRFGSTSYKVLRQITWAPSGGVVKDTALGSDEAYDEFATDKQGNLFFARRYDPSIKVWNGKSVKSLGYVKGTLHSMVVDDDLGRLYVGGEFDTAGGIFSPMVAAIDLHRTAVAAKPLGSPAYTDIRIRSARNRLLVSGPSGGLVYIHSLSGRLLKTGVCGMPIDIQTFRKQALLVQVRQAGAILLTKKIPNP
jgi:hypothetical protein